MATLIAGFVVILMIVLAGLTVARLLRLHPGYDRRPESTELDWSIPYKIESDAPPVAGFPPLRPVQPRAAALRALCLAAFLDRSEIENLATPQRELRLAALVRWVHAEGIYPLLSDIERRGLELHPGLWDDPLILYTEGAREALGVLAWAGHFREEFPAFDRRIEAAALCTSLGIRRPTGPMLLDLSMREEHDLLNARNLTQAWIWRARTALDHSNDDEAAREMIRSAARYWETMGAFRSINQDFPVGSRSFAELEPAESRHIHRRAQLRLHGLNWVCGLAHDWDRVSTWR